MYVSSPIILHTLQLVGLLPVSLARLRVRSKALHDDDFSDYVGVQCALDFPGSPRVSFCSLVQTPGGFAQGSIEEVKASVFKGGATQDSILARELELPHGIRAQQCSDHCQDTQRGPTARSSHPATGFGEPLIVLLTRWRINTVIQAQEIIESKKAEKYLGVTFDTKL
ncbi:hypothetical protein J6590_061007 [Homalodisca vitripennis]|nr:hypothetical protein J6590_061007 [Homalodisca vitripennis]